MSDAPTLRPQPTTNPCQAFSNLSSSSSCTTQHTTCHHVRDVSLGRSMILHYVVKSPRTKANGIQQQQQHHSKVISEKHFDRGKTIYDYRRACQTYFVVAVFSVPHRLPERLALAHRLQRAHDGYIRAVLRVHFQLVGSPTPIFFPIAVHLLLHDAVARRTPPCKQERCYTLYYRSFIENKRNILVGCLQSPAPARVRTI